MITIYVVPDNLTHSGQHKNRFALANGKTAQPPSRHPTGPRTPSHC